MISWQGQHAKLTEKFGAVIKIILTTGGDGKQYEMICLPLRKIPAWLYSINPSWYLDRIKGSHHQFKHPAKPGLVTVKHPDGDVPKGTLASIERQAGWR